MIFNCHLTSFIFHTISVFMSLIDEDAKGYLYPLTAKLYDKCDFFEYSLGTVATLKPI